MKKKNSALLAAIAFVAGCEIGLAISLARMIQKYYITQEAADADPIDQEALDQELEALEETEAEEAAAEAENS